MNTSSKKPSTPAAQPSSSKPSSTPSKAPSTPSTPVKGSAPAGKKTGK